MRTNLKTVARLKRSYTTIDKADGAYFVFLKIGVQSFTVGGYCRTKAEANWMADRLAEALAKLIELETE
jgi:hypothetical protein